MIRGFWFVTGAGVGVYAVLKVRRAAEAFTPEGLQDRLAALSVGAHLFAEEVRAGATVRETELRERLGLALDGGPGLPELSLTPVDTGLPHPTTNGDASQ
jgi:hypothetical protein